PSSPTPHSSRLSSLIPHFCCLFIFSDSTIQWCIQRHRSRVHGATSRYQVLSSSSTRLLHSENILYNFIGNP
ncbi:hypothetical protein LINPERHAP1_LOCUS28391, partial [Linum perenne]